MDSRHLTADWIRLWLEEKLDHLTFLMLAMPRLLDQASDHAAAEACSSQGLAVERGLACDLPVEGTKEGETREAAMQKALDRVLKAKNHRLTETPPEVVEARLSALMALPDEERIPAIETSRFEYACPKLAVELNSRSLAAARRDPQESEILAVLAKAIAHRAQEEEGSRAIGVDLEVQALALQANARRLAGEYRAARSMLGRCRKRLDFGSGDPVVYGDVLVCEAFLFMDLCQRREARRAVRRAIRLFRICNENHKAGKALMALSLIHSKEGCSRHAVQALREAEEVLDFQREPHLRPFVSTNLALYVAEAGDPLKGLEILQEIARESLEGQRARLNRDWIKARIQGLLGETAEATAALASLRDQYAELGDAPNTAITSLELALLFAQQGLPNEVRRVADESLPLIQKLAIPQTVWSALHLFKQAADSEQAGLKVLQEIRDTVADPRGWRGRVVRH